LITAMKDFHSFGEEKVSDHMEPSKEDLVTVGSLLLAELLLNSQKELSKFS